MRRIENERTAETKVTITQDYYRKRGPGHGSEQWTSGQDFQRTNPDCTNDGPTRNPSQLVGIFPDKTTPTGTTITVEDYMINAQIHHSIEAIEIFHQSQRKMAKTGTFFVLRRLKGETSHKIIKKVNQEVINLIFLLFADLTINLRLVLHLTKKNFHETTRRHLMWFALP